MMRRHLAFFKRKVHLYFCPVIGSMAVVTYFHLSPPFFISAAEARQRQKMNKQTVADSEVITENYREREKEREGRKAFFRHANMYSLDICVCVCVCVCREEPKMANITILIIIPFSSSSSSRAPLIQFVFFCVLVRQVISFQLFKVFLPKNVARQILCKTLFYLFKN